MGKMDSDTLLTPIPSSPQPVLDSLAVLVSRALMKKGQDQSSIHSRDLA